MGEKITKDNIDEYITSFIDGEVNDIKIAQELDDILSSDNNLYNKYQSELFTKNLFASRLKMQDVPDSLHFNITNSIENLISTSINKSKSFQISEHPIAESRSFVEYFKKIISVPVRIGKYPIPRYAFAIVLIVIIIGAGLLLNNRKDKSQLNPYIADGSENSIMVQAVNNFHKILKGEIKPQISSKNESDVKNYLKSNVDYDVYIPCMENCESISAVCSEYNGQKIVHIVYRSGDDVFYICETPSKSLNKKCMELPEAVHNEIVSKKYYMCDKIDLDNDCTMLMWYSGNIVCTSVSTMPKQKMYSAFTNFK